ncbi:hypothetical protein [Pimelobacter simplex]|uniref:hypothetical protein n=1 Tax=Nocardioides simplex TaxID=2045 RepID=UPI003AAD8C31
MTRNDGAPKSNRFSAAPIWNAHKKGLRNRSFKQAMKSAPDLLARWTLYGVPVLLGGASWYFGATVAAIDGLLAAAGVLAGGLFMGFTQVAAWRDRYTERTDTHETAEKPQRYSLDETVAHILMATYGCFVLVVVVLVGANFANAKGELTGPFAAATVLVGSYVLLLMAIILPKLYAAYAVTHKVDREMSGLSR